MTSKLPSGHSCERRKCASFQQNEEWYIEQYIKCVLDIGRHMETTMSSTKPVQFQYNSRLGIPFQDHHTLRTSTDNGNTKTGKSSTCKCTPHANYFMEWTSSTLCTCPQAAASGSETQRLISLEKSPAPTQWKDFCEQTPIDKARHSVTLFWLL